MTGPVNPRRLMIGAARKYLFDGRDPEEVLGRVADIDATSDVPRLTPTAMEMVLARPAPATPSA